MRKGNLRRSSRASKQILCVRNSRRQKICLPRFLLIYRDTSPRTARLRSSRIRFRLSPISFTPIRSKPILRAARMNARICRTGLGALCARCLCLKRLAEWASLRSHWVWTAEVFSLGIPVAGVFWRSFYEERDPGRFLEKAIEYASGGKIGPKQISSDRDRVDVLANLLRQSRFLQVLDGFERVLRAYARMDAAYRGDEVDEDARNDYRACTDPNIGIFLKCLASGGTLTKTLITSRLFPRELDGLDGVRHLQLTGMDAADAVEFFHKQGIKGTHVEIETACAAYGFHPLTLRLLAGALRQDPRYHAGITNAPRVEMREADKDKRMQRMLEFAYNSLPPQDQKLLSQLAAFRSPMKWETIEAIFCDVIASAEGAKQSPTSELGIASSQKPLLAMTMTKGDLARAISNLAERGLYMRDSVTDTLDLHPVIRRYCYGRLSDPALTHARFVVYFVKIETPKKDSIPC